jgi:HEAT repeat protein
MEDEPIRNALAGLISDDTSVQVEALRRLADLGPQATAAIPILIELKAYPEYLNDRKVLDEINRALAQIGEAGTIEIFKILADKNESERIRMEAAATLASLGKAGLPFLLAAMDHEDLAVRLFSVDALPETGALGFEAISRLEGLLHDHTNVGNSAAIALACLARHENVTEAGSKSAGEILLEGFERGTPVTRRRIVDALSFLDDNHTVFNLIMAKAVRDGDELVRQDASHVDRYVSRMTEDEQGEKKGDIDQSP